MAVLTSLGERALFRALFYGVDPIYSYTGIAIRFLEVGGEDASEYTPLENSDPVGANFVVRSDQSAGLVVDVTYNPDSPDALVRATSTWCVWGMDANQPVLVGQLNSPLKVWQGQSYIVGKFSLRIAIECPALCIKYRTWLLRTLLLCRHPEEPLPPALCNIVLYSGHPDEDGMAITGTVSPLEFFNGGLEGQYSISDSLLLAKRTIRLANSYTSGTATHAVLTGADLDPVIAIPLKRPFPLSGQTTLVLPANKFGLGVA